jgi:hypothetical protein
MHLSFAQTCVADTTFKAFFLSFLWGGSNAMIQFILNAFAFILGGPHLTIFIAIHSGCLGVGFLTFGLCMLFEERRDFSFYDRNTRRAGRKIHAREILATFGDSWWQWIIPLPSGCTAMAWLGVDWGDECGS